MFSFLYRIFYDRTLFPTFVKNGKGFGFKILFALTLFVGFCLSFRIFVIFSSITPQTIATVSANFPEIVIKDGRITSPQDYRYSYVFFGNTIFFVFDTTKNPPDFNGLPDIGLYVTSDALLSINSKEIKRLPLARLLNGSDLILDQGNIYQWGLDTVSKIKLFFFLFLFIFSLPGLFSLYFITCLFYMAFSFLPTYLMKKTMSWEQRFRLSVLSILPAYVLDALAFLLGVKISTELFGIFITLFYMFCLLKDDDQRENVVTQQI